MADLLRSWRLESSREAEKTLRWTRIRTDDLPKLAALPAGDATEVLAIATLNHSGYVREAALKLLAELAHPRAAGPALQRLGDWVPQVRAAAEALAFALLRAGHVEAFLANHGGFEAAERITRVDMEPLLERLREGLRAAEFRERVLARLDAADANERRFVFRVLEPELTASRELAGRAARDRSVAIRAWAAERLARTPDAQRDLVEMLVVDPDPRVSRAAIQWLSPPLDARLAALVETRIDASMRGLRESARFALEGSGVGDFPQRYRARLAAGPPVRPGAIEGLGEVGDSGDLATVQVFAHDADPRLRAAALSAECRLAPEPDRARLVAALRDSSRRVRHIARRELLGRLDEATVRDLRAGVETLDETRRRGVRALLASRSRWDCVPDLLDALHDPAPSIQDAAARKLQAWHARHASEGWLRPSEATRLALGDALDRFDARPGLPEEAGALPRVLAWAREVCGRPR